jgi:hypothetical protein
MASVQGPLLSLKATGTFGKTITYQGRGSNTAAFVPVTPYDPKSVSQLGIRDYISKGIYYYHKLTPAYITAWNAFVI